MAAGVKLTEAQRRLLYAVIDHGPQIISPRMQGVLSDAQQLERLGLGVLQSLEGCVELTITPAGRAYLEGPRAPLYVTGHDCRRCSELGLTECGC
jgi:hypothetical protein